MEAHKIHKFEIYKKRPIKFLELARFEDWSIKIYGITSGSENLSEKIVLEGKNTAMTNLPRPAVTDKRYGLGFLIIHQARLETWFLLNWWKNENVIHHQVFFSTSNDPEKIEPVIDKSILACIYELEVYSFERKAWISTVLSSKKNQSFERYLGERLNTYSAYDQVDE